jgi:DNA-binding transcriptional regulator YiaG
MEVFPQEHTHQDGRLTNMRRNNRRHFSIRTTDPTSTHRFRNFVTLFGIHRLANDLAVHESTVQDWKAGRKLPSHANVAKLVRFSESLLTRATPPEDVLGDGRPLTLDDILHSETLEFRERTKP